MAEMYINELAGAEVQKFVDELNIARYCIKKNKEFVKLV
jgi:hypothetical protein